MEVTQSSIQFNVPEVKTVIEYVDVGHVWLLSINKMCLIKNSSINIHLQIKL